MDVSIPDDYKKYFSDEINVHNNSLSSVTPSAVGVLSTPSRKKVVYSEVMLVFDSFLFVLFLFISVHIIDFHFGVSVLKFCSLTYTQT